MIEKGQAFVRAINADGKWGSVDVLNLTEESFKRFVITNLNEIGSVVCINSEKDEPAPLYEKAHQQ